jgi:hypothetical protein
VTDWEAGNLLAAAGDMLTALVNFPRAGQHNLNSTATREERSEYIRKVMHWGNTTRLEAIDAAGKEGT